MITMSELLIIPILVIFVYITTKIVYKLMILVFACINSVAKYDKEAKERLLYHARHDKMWHDVAKELDILDGD